MTLYAIIAAGAILLYLVAKAVLAVTKQAGRDEALKEISDQAASLDHKRAEEMLKEKTVGQVIQDLISGKF